MRKENEYQPKLIEKLRLMFPGCFILKNDSSYIQGIPDLTILYGPYWAILEVKRSEKEMANPKLNQSYYIEQFDAMSFAAFIYPGNEEEVLDGLQKAFSPAGFTRFS